MKTKFHFFCIAFLLLAIGSAANAATDIWTNTAGGDWNNFDSWILFRW